MKKKKKSKVKTKTTKPKKKAPGKDFTSRRAFLRVPMMVKVQDAETGQEGQFFSKEISIGGLFLETDRPYPIGKMFEIDFDLPGLERAIRAKAKVVHVNLGEQPDLPVGMGLAFTDMDGHSEEKIIQYVEKLDKIRKKLSK